jgi:hypothetical protein
MGRRTSKAGCAASRSIPIPYLIFYQISGDQIVIHGVRHSARDPSSMPD